MRKELFKVKLDDQSIHYVFATSFSDVEEIIRDRNLGKSIIESIELLCDELFILKNEGEKEMTEKDDLCEKWDAKEILSQSLLRNNFYVYEIQPGEILSWKISPGQTSYYIKEDGTTIEKITSTMDRVFPQEFSINVKADSLKEALDLFTQKENEYYAKITEQIKDYKKGILSIRINPTKLKEESLYAETISILVIV